MTHRTPNWKRMQASIQSVSQNTIRARKDSTKKTHIMSEIEEIIERIKNHKGSERYIILGLQRYVIPNCVITIERIN